MEELEKVATPMTVREYLNTLETEEFAQMFIIAEAYITNRYIDTDLDAADISFSVEYDIIEWLNSPYCADKELLPSENIEIDEDEFDIEDFDE